MASVAREVTSCEMDWILDVLGRRRQRLLPFAPRFWNPSSNGGEVHRAYLSGLLDSGKALGFACGDSVLIAARSQSGWLVDDAAVDEEKWGSEGAELWAAMCRVAGGEEVRMVCPVYEPRRAEFAAERGLTVVETWWLKELTPHDRPAGSLSDVAVLGADATLVHAPPVYDPGGPIMLLREVIEAEATLGQASEVAGMHGCAGIVVALDGAMPDPADVMHRYGFRPHCEFYEGRA